MNEEQGSAAPEAAVPNGGVETHAVDSASPENVGEQASPKQERPAVPRSVINRIGALTRKHEEAIREASQWRERAEAYERQQAANGQTQNAPAREPQVDPNQVMATATEIARFNLKCDEVAAKGEAVPGFQNALSNLGTLGPSRDALGVIIDADDPPKLIAYLGQHLDEAADILAKPPAAMARALAKLETKLAQPEAVSAAPAPIKPVRSSSAKSDPEPGTPEWVVWRNKQRVEKYGHA